MNVYIYIHVKNVIKKEMFQFIQQWSHLFGDEKASPERLTAIDRVKSRSCATASLRAWLAMTAFILIRIFSCPMPRVMETPHKWTTSITPHK